MANNKQLMLTAPTVHCTLPFCIAPCSVCLLGSAVADFDLVLEPDDERVCEKNLCVRGD